MKSWIITLLCSWPMVALANTEVWIDVASQEEYAKEHVHNALHIPHTYIGRGISARYPDKNTAIKLYGRNEDRAQQASQVLQVLGYQKITHISSLSELKALGLVTKTNVTTDEPAPHRLDDTAALYLNNTTAAPY